MSDNHGRWRVPLIVWVGLGVLGLAGLIALAVFVPRFAWLRTVLLILAGVAMVVPEFIWRYRRIQGQSPTAERYRDFMAAFGVKRTGRTMRNSSRDFTD